MFKKWICQNRNWVFQNFPFLENDFDALTDYELFSKMVEYAKSLDITNKKFVNELKIDLEQMYNEGKFDSFIEEIINLQTTFTFDTVADMKLASNLVDGCFVRTSGFYSYNDGGGSYYKVRYLEETDVVDNSLLIGLNDTDLVAELLFNNELNYLQVGGKINDSSIDSTDLVQKLINVLSDKKCGKIYFPQGIIYFKGTITLKSNVELIGFGDYSQWNANDELRQNIVTTFRHIPENESNFIISNYTDTSQLNYQPNINIKNLYIVGTENTLNGLYLLGISKSVIENIVIINCQNNIHIEYSMTTDFIRVFSQRASNYCLLIDKESNIDLSTTTNFYNCYFGQTVTTGGSPMKIDYRSLVGGNFVCCTFESSYESIEIDSFNELYFTDIYCENIPSSGNNPMFKIGTTASVYPNENEKGIITFNGGTIYGCGEWYSEDNKATIFDIDYINNLTLVGTTLRRADYTVKLTSNTDRLTFIGTTEGQIEHGINTYKNSNKILYVNCNNTSFAIDDKTFIPKSTITLNDITPENGWTVYDGLQYATFGNIVSLYISCESGTLTSGTTIGTLPSGLAPSSIIKITPSNIVDGVVLDSYNYFFIDKDGHIKIWGNDFASDKVYEGNITYMVK